jgi:acyl-CoA thioesterase I
VTGQASSFDIVALGTSLTASGGWLAALGRQLQAALDRPVRTANLGHPGATSRRGLARLDEVAAMPAHLVLIEFSINDAALHRAVPLSESLDNAARIIDALRRRDPAPWLALMTMNPTFGLRSLLRPRLERYYEGYRCLAAAAGVTLADNRQSWDRLAPRELRRAIPDGLHPRPEAAGAIVPPTVAAAVAAHLPAMRG